MTVEAPAIAVVAAVIVVAIIGLLRVFHRLSGPAPIGPLGPLLPPEERAAEEAAFARRSIGLTTVFLSYAFSVFVIIILIAYGGQVTGLVGALIGSVLTSLLQNATTVYQYWFGSSSGSAIARAALAQKADGNGSSKS